MRLMYNFRIRAGLVFIIVACGHIPVAAIAEEAMQKRIENLVQQLGDDSYRVREHAVEELLKSGLQTKAALFAGMKSRQDDRMLFSPASLGFKDDSERRGAFDKWRAWLARKAGDIETP
ncbi:MAG: hypothetical protein ACKO38_09555 [Planctomycetota bacterium]